MMRILVSCVVLLAAGLARPSGAAAQAPDSSAKASAVVAPAPSVRPLLKLGTGLTRGFAFAGFTGLSLPVVLGIEHQLAPGWTAYANAYVGLRVAGRRYHNWPYQPPFFYDPSFDLGVRRYYGQAKRQAKGRATGPFVGNYVAVHLPTTFTNTRIDNGQTRFIYNYTALMAMWGMQRRLGKHGLFDAYAGAGISNPRVYYYDPATGFSGPRRQVGIAVEVGAKISLVR